MKVRIAEKPAPFFRVVKGVIDAPSSELPVSTELDCGVIRDVRVFSGKQCLPAKLADGQRGYIFADTLVAHLKQVALMTDRVPLYDGPSFDAAIVTKLGKYKQGLLLETTERGGKKWNKLRIVEGESRLEGYIEMVTPVRILPDLSKGEGRRCAVVALRWWAATLAIGLIAAAYDLGVTRTCIGASVPFYYAMRFTIAAVWNLGGAAV